MTHRLYRRLWQGALALLTVCIFFESIALPDSRSIRQAIFAAIDAEPEFGPYEIEIDASRGIVTLEGVVASEDSRKRVAAIAQGQGGVDRVINKLEVSTASSGSQENSRLAQAVKSALMNSAVRSRYSLNVLAQESSVTLRGEVGSQEDRRLLEETARLTPGVTHVINELKVQGSPDDAELQARVEAALRKNVPDLQIGVTVSVRDGVVTLSGSKDNHREIDHLLSIALMVEGVRDIISNLELNSAG